MIPYRALALGCLLLGCKTPEGPAPERTAPDTEADAPAHADKGARDAAAPSHEAHLPHARKFAVPFAAEADREDPLAQTRGYFQALLSDNGAYMRSHDAGFFKAFAGLQKPRATVVACSDSRVQSTAFDATPENDVFFVRNIGNQVANGEGSVEYGVHHLKTPVLLILGHTGCGAVKAAMGDYSKESDAIRRELDPMKLSKKSGEKDKEKAGEKDKEKAGEKDKEKTGEKEIDAALWLEGVLANVHAQVARSLEKFDEEIAAGNLTVVGAVYDFRNDMRQGAGKVAIVDVNGSTEPAKLQAFERGVLGLGPAPSDKSRAGEKDAGAEKEREAHPAPPEKHPSVDKEHEARPAPEKHPGVDREHETRPAPERHAAARPEGSSHD